MNVDQILDRLVNDIESVTDNLNSHLAGVGNGHGVSVDCFETLLENRLLTASGGDLLLALVTVEVLLEDGINDEARSQLVDVLALLTIHVHVRIGSDLSLRDLWKFRHNVECESAELLNVNAFARAKRVVQVRDQGSPDDLHLRFGFKGLLTRDSPLRGEIMLARVRVRVLKNVVNNAVN